MRPPAINSDEALGQPEFQRLAPVMPDVPAVNRVRLPPTTDEGAIGCTSTLHDAPSVYVVESSRFACLSECGFASKLPTFLHIVAWTNDPALLRVMARNLGQ
jgi:hypothetical protein